MERSLFDEVGGFDEELRCHEDYDFILKIAKTREILYVDEPLYHKHDLSESVNKNVKYYLEATLMLIDRYRSDYIRFGLLEEKVGRVMEEAKAYGCLDQVAAILQQILA